MFARLELDRRQQGVCYEDTLPIRTRKVCGSMTNIVNPFEQQGHWYKANFHTHTTTSDGEASLEERVQQYSENGYQVLAITDHNKTNDVTGLSSDGFLVISGMETHPDCPGHYQRYHLLCLNVPHGLEFPEEADANERIRLVKEVGGEMFLSHPYWSGHSLAHLQAVQGYIGIEVFNSTCTRFGKGFSSVNWDGLLNAGRILPAIAVDDTHRGRDIFLGWTMVKAPELTVPAIMDALRKGCYYASCGPIIEDFRVTDGTVHVECSPATEVHFMCHSFKGTSLYVDDGEPITQADFTLKEGSKFVRVEVVDARGRRAWTNPLVV